MVLSWPATGEPVITRAVTANRTSAAWNRIRCMSHLFRRSDTVGTTGVRRRDGHAGGNSIIRGKNVGVKPGKAARIENPSCRDRTPYRFPCRPKLAPGQSVRL